MNQSAATDPRDEGRPGLKEWEEFRAQFAGAFLYAWLVDMPRDSLNQALDNLREGAAWAAVQAEGPLDEGEDVALFGPNGECWSWPPEDALALEEQLFPHGDTQHECAALILRLAIVALHGAFESYCRASHQQIKGKQPLAALQRYLAARNRSLDEQTASDLAELHATRNIVVHDRGLVDSAYLEQLPDSPLQIEERKLLERGDLFRFARAVWRCATILRTTAESQA